QHDEGDDAPLRHAVEERREEDEHERHADEEVPRQDTRTAIARRGDERPDDDGNSKEERLGVARAGAADDLDDHDGQRKGGDEQRERLGRPPRPPAGDEVPHLDEEIRDPERAGEDMKLPIAPRREKSEKNRHRPTWGNNAKY